MRYIAGYRILQRIGSGGSATVYRASRDGVECALKLLTDPELDSSRVERFEREAELLSRLEHPGLLRVLDWGEADGQFYLCTELLPGETLLDAVMADPATETRAGNQLNWLLRRFEEIAETLQYLHDNGVIHRDVKPENIFIDAEGRARLGDLGIAHDELQHTLTYDGEFLGTPHYVSPEQAMAGRVTVDHRTDIYSLGVSLFHCLTGDHPFRSGSYQEVLRQVILENPPLLRRLRPGLSADLEAIVAQCMEKNAQHRYADAASLAKDLRRVRNYQAVSARRPQRLRRLLRWTGANRTQLLVAACCVALAFVGIQQFFLSEHKYADWVRVEVRELGARNDVRVVPVPVSDAGGAAPTLGAVRSSGRGRWQVQPFVLFEIELTLDDRRKQLRHLFSPQRAGKFFVRWRDESPEQLGFVRVEGTPAFYVRPTPLTVGEVLDALASLPPGERDAAIGISSTVQRLQGRDRQLPALTTTYHAAQMAATALGYRLLTFAEWDRLRHALEEGSVRGSEQARETLSRIVMEPPMELLANLTYGTTDLGMPISPRFPRPAEIRGSFSVVCHGADSAKGTLDYEPDLGIAQLENSAPHYAGWTILVSMAAE